MNNLISSEQRRLFLRQTLGASIGVALAGGLVNTTQASDTQIPEVVIPAFKGTTIDGSSFSLEQTKGKVVLVTFWATWCPTCRAEMPELRKVYNDRLSKGMEWVNISIDEKMEDIVQWRNLLKTTGTDVRNPLIWASNPGNQHNLGRVRATPTHILIDRSGKQANRWRGVFAERNRVELDKLLLAKA